MPVTTTWSIHSLTGSRVSVGRMPMVVPPALLAPRAAAAITSPSPPVTTVAPRSASSRPTVSAFSSCSVPLPTTETWMAICAMLGHMSAPRQARGGVLVVGGGFAGAYVAKELGHRGATIVSKENFMLYTPLLPEAASGTLEPRHCVVPLREMCPHAELILGSVTAFDLEAKTAAVETDEGPQTVEWAQLGPGRRGPADPARHPAAARRIRGGRAAQARDRDPRRDDARVGYGRQRRARRRDADPNEHARVDGGRRAEPRPAPVVAAARREGPRRGGRAAPRARARACVGARRLRARPEHAQRPPRSAHLPARAPPSAAPRAQPDRPARAIRLPHARPGRDARPPQGHRGGARPEPARLPRLVGDALVSPVPASARAAEGAGRRRLDGGALLPPR